jgi:hypothetical protein
MLFSSLTLNVDRNQLLAGQGHGRFDNSEVVRPKFAPGPGGQQDMLVATGFAHAIFLLS